MNSQQKAERNIEIIKLVKSGLRLSEISKKYNLTYSAVKSICDKNNIIIPPKINLGWSPKFTNRNTKIIELVIAGEKYDKIAKKYKLTEQRVQQIAKTKNTSSNKVRLQKYHKEVEEIKEQLKEGICYIDVYKNHNLSNLRKCGLPKVADLLEKRNKKIIHSYKKGTSAKSIVENGVCGINGLTQIYNIIHKAGSNRHPHIITIKKNYINEDEKILKLIKKLRDKKLSFKKIADYLNDNNYKTITGKSFSEDMVRIKYKQSLKINHKK